METTETTARKGIQIDALRNIGNGPAFTWLEWPGMPEVEILIEYAPRDATREFYGMKEGDDKARDVPPDEFRDWYLSHVKDWRGVYQGDKPARFDRTALHRPWKEDLRFQVWLIGGCREVATFLRNPNTAPAVEVRPDSE